MVRAQQQVEKRRIIVDQPDAVRSPAAPAPRAAGPSRLLPGLAGAVVAFALAAAPLAAVGTSFYTVRPCRGLDTRGPAGPFGAPPLAAAAPRPFTGARARGVPAPPAAL